MIEGGCFCGAIRYRITQPVGQTAACHCRKCQYGSGGGPNYVVLAPKDAVEITAGTPAVFRSRSDNGAEVARLFCATCATALWSEGSHMTFLPVRVGSLDDPSPFRAALHIWAEAAPEWHHFEDGAPVFEQGPGSAQRR